MLTKGSVAKRKSLNECLITSKLTKMSETEKKLWKQRSADVILKRLHSIQVKQKNALSQYDIPIRWKCRRSYTEHYNPNIPPQALLRFRKFLYSRKKTHPVFYPVITEIANLEDKSGCDKLSDSSVCNEIFNNDQLKSDVLTSPSVNKLWTEDAQWNSNNLVTKDRPRGKNEWDLIDICSDTEMEQASGSEETHVPEATRSGGWLRKDSSNSQSSSELFKENFESDESKLEAENGIVCPICNKKFAPNHVQGHATRCASKYFKD